MRGWNIGIIIIIVDIMQFFQKCNGGGKIFINLLEYKNPTKRQNDGNCCDRRCRNPCKNHFEFCFSDVITPNVCLNLKTSAKNAIIDDDFQFHLVQIFDGERGATFEINFKGKVPKRLQFRTTVHNLLSSNNNLVAHFFEYIDVESLLERISTNYTLIHGSGRRKINEEPFLLVNIKAQCYDDYMGRQCNIWKCQPRNDAKGHYTCTKDNKIVCLPGWKNVDNYCTENVIPSIISTSSQEIFITPTYSLSNIKEVTTTSSTSNIIDVTTTSSTSNVIEVTAIRSIISNSKSIRQITPSINTNKILPSTKAFVEFTSSLNSEIIQFSYAKWTGVSFSPSTKIISSFESDTFTTDTPSNITPKISSIAPTITTSLCCYGNFISSMTNEIESIQHTIFPTTSLRSRYVNTRVTQNKATVNSSAIVVRSILGAGAVIFVSLSFILLLYLRKRWQRLRKVSSYDRASETSADSPCKSLEMIQRQSTSSTSNLIPSVFIKLDRNHEEKR